MAGINNLKDIYEKKGEDFLKNLLNNYVIINEKSEGSFFGVKKSKDDSFKYFKKAGEITYVDRILTKFYNRAIEFFEKMPLEDRQRIPSNFYFGFDYTSPENHKSSFYKKAPKEGLILNFIHKLSDSGEVVSTIHSKEQLENWAEYLGVESPLILFEGILNDEQKVQILEFVHTREKELFEKFKTTSFTKYLLDLLEVGEKESILNKKSEFDSIIFRFYDKDEENPSAKTFLAKLVDPLFNKKEEQQDTQTSQDYIWLIVIDLMNFIESYETKKLKLIAKEEGDFEQKYLTLINQIFKDFMGEYSKKYEGVLIEIPEYLKRPEFELDMSLVKDPEVKKILKQGETPTEIYKVLLNFFRRTRKRSSSSFFTKELLTQLNSTVAKIKNIIMGDEIYESLFPSFSEFIGGPGEILINEDQLERETNKIKSQLVNLVVGSFQPISNGYLKVAKKLKDKNELKTVFIAIKDSKKTKLSPLSPEITGSLLEKVKRANPDLIADVKMISSGSIEKIIAELKPQWEPVLIAGSEKRTKDYALQLENILKRNIPLRINSKIELVEVPVIIKGEEIIKTLTSSNYTDFKKLTPPEIHSDFFNLQSELKVNEEKESTFLEEEKEDIE